MKQFDFEIQYDPRTSSYDVEEVESEGGEYVYADQAKAEIAELENMIIRLESELGVCDPYHPLLEAVKELLKHKER